MKVMKSLKKGPVQVWIVFINFILFMVKSRCLDTLVEFRLCAQGSQREDPVIGDLVQ